MRKRSISERIARTARRIAIGQMRSESRKAANHLNEEEKADLIQQGGYFVDQSDYGQRLSRIFDQWAALAGKGGTDIITPEDVSKAAEKLNALNSLWSMWYDFWNNFKDLGKAHAQGDFSSCETMTIRISKRMTRFYQDLALPILKKEGIFNGLAVLDKNVASRGGTPRTYGEALGAVAAAGSDSGSSFGTAIDNVRDNKAYQKAFADSVRGSWDERDLGHVRDWALKDDFDALTALENSVAERAKSTQPGGIRFREEGKLYNIRFRGTRPSGNDKSLLSALGEIYPSRIDTNVGDDGKLIEDEVPKVNGKPVDSKWLSAWIYEIPQTEGDYGTPLTISQEVNAGMLPELVAERVHEISGRVEPWIGSFSQDLTVLFHQINVLQGIVNNDQLRNNTKGAQSFLMDMESMHQEMGSKYGMCLFHMGSKSWGGKKANEVLQFIGRMSAAQSSRGKVLRQTGMDFANTVNRVKNIVGQGTGMCNAVLLDMFNGVGILETFTSQLGAAGNVLIEAIEGNYNFMDLLVKTYRFGSGRKKNSSENGRRMIKAGVMDWLKEKSGKIVDWLSGNFGKIEGYFKNLLGCFSGIDKEMDEMKDNGDKAVSMLQECVKACEEENEAMRKMYADVKEFYNYFSGLLEQIDNELRK